MLQNVGGFERVFRGVVGIWLVVVAVAALRIERRTVAAITGIAGRGLLQNAMTGFCTCNWLFGIDTASEGCEGTFRS
jgi:hypothetical protein